MHKLSQSRDDERDQPACTSVGQRSAHKALMCTRLFEMSDIRLSGEIEGNNLSFPVCTWQKQTHQLCNISMLLCARVRGGLSRS